MHFREALRRQVIVIDGAMGTQVQNLGLADEDFGGAEFRMLTDLLTLAHPGALRQIHLDYYRAGARAVETNTFGASPFRLAEFDFSRIDPSRFEGLDPGADLRRMSREDIALLINRRAAAVACEARDARLRDPGHDGGPLWVIGSIGPSNRVLSSTDASLAVSTFDEVAENFRLQAQGLIEGGADVLLFETQQDILETKAAVIGARRAIAASGRDIAVMCQVTVDAFSRMQIFNTDIHAAQVALGHLGIDTFGINCSIGPDLMAKTVEKMARLCPLPISVVPNAGLPVSEDGRTVFKFAPDKMAEYLGDYVRAFGVGVVGGCCGTTPDHIAAIAEAVGGAAPRERSVSPMIYVSGPQNAVAVDSSAGLVRIGERLNVRGSKKVRDAVEGGGGIDQDALEEVVHDQVHELGLGIIDVCMDSNQVDTTETLKAVIYRQTTDFPGAMCIDSFSWEALAEAVKVYPGRPILNSMSLEEVAPGLSKIDALLGATAEHGALYVALAADQQGPADTAERKADLARKILDKAAAHGVAPGRIFIDMNVFPVGSESREGMNFAVESLEAIPLIKALHPDVLTTCGVGNLTMGLAKKPHMRTVLTSVWLDEARKRGLDSAIINPNHYVFVENLDPHEYRLGLRAIMDHDMEAYAELEEIAERKTGTATARRTTYDDLPAEEAVCEKIKDGHKQREHGSVEVGGRVYKYADRIVVQAAEAITRHEPLDFINTHLMGAMNELGDGFARGDVSLPHLLKSADVMKQVMGFLEAYMRDSSGVEVHEEIAYKGTVVIGTVYQDVHSIGKDLARTLFENYGYRVIDLGVMTPLQQFLDAAREHSADAIGMSALLVQTSNHMITVSRMMEEQGLEHLPVLIGGAPVSHRHAAYVAMAGRDDPAAMRSNVFYCATAMDGVNVMNAWAGGREREPMLAENLSRLAKSHEKAVRRAQADSELMRTLPRRAVLFDAHQLRENPWLPYRTVSFPLRDFAPRIDRKTLFALNWKFGGSVSRERQGETPEKLDALFNEWVGHADHESWIRPMGVFGVFPCQSDGDTVILHHPENPGEELCRVAFDVVIGAGRKDVVSGAQYFHPADSGRFDAIGLQLATSGPQVDTQINRFREDGDSEACLYLQGLSDRVAEDLAEHLHGLLREHMGVGPGQGIRWSPGYPAISDTAHNQTILGLLHATDLIGVRITEAGEFAPTGTTAALVSFHPDARYT